MLYVVLGIVGAMGLLVALGRWNAGRAEQRFRDEIRRYVEKRGGKVTFDPDGTSMMIQHPNGTAHEKLMSLRVMLSAARDRELTLGLALRKYFPDKFDEAFAITADARLDAVRADISKLGPDELRARTRVKVVSSRTHAAGLATAARALTDRLEVRVVLDGFDLDGIPTDARAKLVEDDAALFESALAHTVGEPPALERGGASGHAWLAALGRIFGEKPAIVAATGKDLAWLVAPASVNAIAKLVASSRSDGALKGVVVGWDGSITSGIGVTAHSIKGPATPDYTLELTPALGEAFGLATDARGQVGVDL